MNDPLDVDLEDAEQIAEIALVADLMVAASESPDNLDSVIIDKLLGVAAFASPGGRKADPIQPPRQRGVLAAQIGRGSGL
jgi:hypothetical protein